MAAYCIFDIHSESDPQAMAEYRRLVKPTIAAFGGRVLVTGHQLEVVEGGWQPKRPVIIEFPSLERVHEWFDSELYAELKTVRLAASEGDVVFMDGVPQSPG